MKPLNQNKYIYMNVMYIVGAYIEGNHKYCQEGNIGT